MTNFCPVVKATGRTVGIEKRDRRDRRKNTDKKRAADEAALLGYTFS